MNISDDENGTTGNNQVVSCHPSENQKAAHVRFMQGKTVTFLNREHLCFCK